MIGILVWGRVRIKIRIRIGVRVRVGITLNDQRYIIGAIAAGANVIHSPQCGDEVWLDFSHCTNKWQGPHDSCTTSLHICPKKIVLKSADLADEQQFQREKSYS